MIDHQRKLIFVHIARTGGTSIEAALIGRDWWEIDRGTKHLSASQTRRHFGDQFWNEYVKFAVVRNPWDRLVSMWATGWWHANDSKAAGTSFGDFVQTLRPHRHEHYESLFYHDIIDEPLDRILRFERLGEDFAALMAECGAPDIALPHCEKRQRGDYRTYYDAETRDLVARLFERDIRDYGYEF